MEFIRVTRMGTEFLHTLLTFAQDVFTCTMFTVLEARKNVFYSKPGKRDYYFAR